MLKTIAIVVFVLLAAVLVFAATRPDTFRVERTTTIQAAPEEIFALINDFDRWRAWSPYEQLDPAMKRSLGGAASGQGATYAWESQGKAGVGRMEITQSALSTGSSPSGAAPSNITIQLDFTKPFEAHNIAEFTLQPQGDTTRVTWAMHGPNPYLGKVMQLFFSMDRMVGQDFETGLARLKTLAET